jgi:hypothetical protein
LPTNLTVNQGETGYATIVLEMLNLFERVKDYVGFEEHSGMIRLEIATLKAGKQSNKLTCLR